MTEVKTRKINHYAGDVEEIENGSFWNTLYFSQQMADMFSYHKNKRGRYEVEINGLCLEFEEVGSIFLVVSSKNGWIELGAFVEWFDYQGARRLGIVSNIQLPGSHGSTTDIVHVHFEGETGTNKVKSWEVNPVSLKSSIKMDKSSIKERMKKFQSSCKHHNVMGYRYSHVDHDSIPGQDRSSENEGFACRNCFLIERRKTSIYPEDNHCAESDFNNIKKLKGVRNVEIVKFSDFEKWVDSNVLFV